MCCAVNLSIVTVERLTKLEFGGQWPLTTRARCSAFRYFPNPLGIVTAEVLDILDFTELDFSQQSYILSQTNPIYLYNRFQHR